MSHLTNVSFTDILARYLNVCMLKISRIYFRPSIKQFVIDAKKNQLDGLDYIFSAVIPKNLTLVLPPLVFIMSKSLADPRGR